MTKVTVKRRDDLSSLPQKDQRKLEQHEEAILKAKAGHNKSAVLIGQELVAIHSILSKHGSGCWRQRIRDKCNFSHQQAYRYIRIATWFGDCNNLLQFDLSALHLLSAPSAPSEAKDEAIGLADDGQMITHAMAKKLVAQHKSASTGDDTFDSGRELDRCLSYLDRLIERCSSEQAPAFVTDVIKHLQSRLQAIGNESEGDESTDTAGRDVSGDGGDEEDEVLAIRPVCSTDPATAQA